MPVVEQPRPVPFVVLPLHADRLVQPQWVVLLHCVPPRVQLDLPVYAALGVDERQGRAQVVAVVEVQVRDGGAFAAQLPLQALGVPAHAVQVAARVVAGAVEQFFLQRLQGRGLLAVAGFGGAQQLRQGGRLAAGPRLDAQQGHEGARVVERVDALRVLRAQRVAQFGEGQGIALPAVAALGDGGGRLLLRAAALRALDAAGDAPAENVVVVDAADPFARGVVDLLVGDKALGVVPVQAVGLPAVGVRFFHEVAAGVPAVAPGAVGHDTVVGPAVAGVAGRGRAVLAQQVEGRVVQVAAHLAGPVTLRAAHGVGGGLPGVACRVVAVVQRLAPGQVGRGQAASGVVGMVDRALRGVDAREPAGHVVVVLARECGQAGMACGRPGHPAIGRAVHGKRLQPRERIAAPAGLARPEIQRHGPVQAVALDVQQGFAVQQQAVHVARAVGQPLQRRQAGQVGPGGRSPRVQGVRALVAPEQGALGGAHLLALAHDAAQAVAPQVHAHLVAVHGGVVVGGHQLSRAVVLEPLGDGRFLRGARQGRDGTGQQLPRAAPLVVDGVARVLGADALAAPVVGMAGHEAVEAGFRDEPVAHVVGEAVGPGILVVQFHEAAGQVVAVVLGEPVRRCLGARRARAAVLRFGSGRTAVFVADHAAPGIVREALAQAAGVVDGDEVIALRRVAPAGGAAQGIGGFGRPAQGVVGRAQLQPFLALHAHRAAPGVVVKARGAAAAVGAAGQQAQRVPLQRAGTAPGVGDGDGQVGVRCRGLGVAVVRGVAQRIGMAHEAAPGVVLPGGDERIAHRAFRCRGLVVQGQAQCVVCDAVAAAGRIGDADDEARGRIDGVLHAAAQRIRVLQQAACGVVLPGGAGAVRLDALGHAGQAPGALEHVAALAAQAVGDQRAGAHRLRRRGRGVRGERGVVEAQVQPVRRGLCNYAALCVVGIARHRAAGAGVARHAARMGRVAVLEAAHGAARAVDHLAQLSAAGIGVAHQCERRGQLGQGFPALVRIGLQPHGHEAHAAVRAPAMGGRRGRSHAFQFEAVAAAGTVGDAAQMARERPVRMALVALHAAEAVADAVQHIVRGRVVVRAARARRGAVRRGGHRPRREDPPGAQRRCGGHGDARIGAHWRRQGTPQAGEAPGMAALVRAGQVLRAAAHEPEAFARAVGDLARRQGLESDAAAPAVVQVQDSGRCIACGQVRHAGFSRHPPARPQQPHGGGVGALVAGVRAHQRERQRAGQAEVFLAGQHLGAQQWVHRMAFGDAARAHRAGDATGRADQHRMRALHDGPAFPGEVCLACGWFALGHAVRPGQRRPNGGVQTAAMIGSAPWAGKGLRKYVLCRSVFVYRKSNEELWRGSNSHRRPSRAATDFHPCNDLIIQQYLKYGRE